jgi:hypothetical protein
MATEGEPRRQPPLTADFVRAGLDYDPATGIFTWKPKPGNVAWDKTWAGRRAGCIGTKGYRYICLNGIKYPAARLAYAHVTGIWFPGIVDHKNLDKDDNRFSNLRLASVAQNSANQRGFGQSGLKGAHRHSPGKWSSEIWVSGKRIKLGYFRTAEEAHAAYVAASEQYHGHFGRHE